MQNKKTSWWQPTKDAIYNHYQGILSKIKSPFEGLTSYLSKKENKDAVKLNALREKQYKSIQEEAKKAQPNFTNITKQVSADTKKYVQEIIDEETKKLGKVPCEFSVVTLGSLAREESGPVTDLEIAILMKEKTIENYKYFHKLSQQISDRLFLLGEHPDIGGKGLRMDEAANAPPIKAFWARNLTPEQAQQLQNEAIMNKDWKKMPYQGSRPYLTTYDEFAQFSQFEFKQDKKAQRDLTHAVFEKEWEKAQRDPKNKKKLKTKEGQKELRSEIGYWVNQMHSPYNNRELGIANQAGKRLGRNMAFFYGNKPNFDAFIAKKNAIFAQKGKTDKTQRQELAKKTMSDDILELIQKGKSPYITGKLDKTLDIKRELYRPVEQLITNLGFYHQCKSQNSIEIVKELANRKVISPAFANQLNDFIQFTTGLRLKEQAILKRQGFATYIDQEEFDEDKTKMEKEIKLLSEAIQYMETVPNASPDTISLKKRALVELKNKYEHLVDMAPNRLITAEDLALLNSKYAPMAKEICEEAQRWTKGAEKLGFNTKAAPKAAPVASSKDANKIYEFVDFVKKHPGGFLPALAMLKAKTDNAPLAAAFINKCKDENLLNMCDKMVLANKGW